MQRVRDSVSLTAIRAALEQQGPSALDDLPDWSEFWTLTKSEPKTAEQVIYEAIVAGATADGRFKAQLTVVNQAAVDVAKRQAALLVVGLSRESRLAIREAVASATAGRMTVAQLARTVRDSVGLTPRFASAVANYRNALQAGESAGTITSRFTLTDQRFSLSNLSAQRVDTMVTRYSERLLAQRATIIARTESLKAAHQGQKALWDAARADGLLPPDVKRVWQVTPDDRLCDLCAPMDGQVIEFDGSFSGTRGNTTYTEETPPIHPGCRCTESLDL